MNPEMDKLLSRSEAAYGVLVTRSTQQYREIFCYILSHTCRAIFVSFCWLHESQGKSRESLGTCYLDGAYSPQGPHSIWYEREGISESSLVTRKAVMEPKLP